MKVELIHFIYQLTTFFKTK